ncbi:LysR family transcriptional regulator [uncultured Sphingorhabdus sp.]|uniref:LysR family transcriptional regulator n=1 Tax=uncultured Sphingorhabdus sp. TaxID=1686106 RepID=UPI0026175F86|nr:LysR family transcriptional regulator [uncultured Sphingorhabdus sp.]HMS19104.1 LysR family transcriptional regulator [Sphingorhabdus sp.]
MQVQNWNDYQAFLAVALSGQLARAAANLGVDATTISRRVKRLERRLDQTLFEKTRTGQILTEAGEKLLEAVELMASAAENIDELKHSKTGPFGNLRISVSEGFGGWLLSMHAQKFIEKNPRLQLELVSGSGFLSPSKREADIAILLSKPRSGPIRAKKLTDYTLRLYASPTYLKRFGNPETLSDLATGHRIVGYVPDLLYAPELQFLEEYDPSLVATIKSTSIIAQLRFIESGAGVGVLPCFIAGSYPGLQRIIPDIEITRSLWLVTHKDNETLSRVLAGKNWLQHLVSEMRNELVPPS